MNDLIQAIELALDPYNVKQAENQLAFLARQNSYIQNLLFVIDDERLEQRVRLAGLVFLKQFILANWEDENIVNTIKASILDAIIRVANNSVIAKSYLSLLCELMRLDPDWTIMRQQIWEKLECETSLEQLSGALACLKLLVKQGTCMDGRLEPLMQKCLSSLNPATELLIEGILRIWKRLEVKEWSLLVCCLERSRFSRGKIPELSTLIVLKWIQGERMVFPQVQLILDNLLSSDQNCPGLKKMQYYSLKTLRVLVEQGMCLNFELLIHIALKFLQLSEETLSLLQTNEWDFIFTLVDEQFSFNSPRWAACQLLKELHKRDEMVVEKIRGQFGSFICCSEVQQEALALAVEQIGDSETCREFAESVFVCELPVILSIRVCSMVRNSAVEATPQMMHFLEKCFFGNSRPVRVFSSWLVATHSKEFSEEVFYRLLEQFRALDDDIVFEPLKRYAEKFPQGFIQSMEQFLEIGGDDGAVMKRSEIISVMIQSRSIPGELLGRAEGFIIACMKRKACFLQGVELAGSLGTTCGEFNQQAICEVLCRNMEWTDFSECAEYLLAALDRHWAGLEEIVKLVSGVFLFYCDGEDDHENILGAILLQRLVETHSIPEVFRNQIQMMVVSNLMLERSPLFTLLSMISMLYFVCVWGTYLNEPEKAILWKWRRLLSLEKYRDFAVMGLMRLGMMPYEEDEEEEQFTECQRQLEQYRKYLQ